MRFMKSDRRRLRACVLAIALAASTPVSPPEALADETSERSASAGTGGEGTSLREGFEIGVDALLIRPLSLGRLLAGGLMLVPASVLQTLALPFGLDVSGYRDQAELLVIEPARDLFSRPLGEDLSG